MVTMNYRTAKGDRVIDQVCRSERVRDRRAFKRTDRQVFRADPMEGWSAPLIDEEEADRCMGVIWCDVCNPLVPNEDDLENRILAAMTRDLDDEELGRLGL